MKNRDLKARHPHSGKSRFFDRERQKFFLAHAFDKLADFLGTDGQDLNSVANGAVGHLEAGVEVSQSPIVKNAFGVGFAVNFRREFGLLFGNLGHNFGGRPNQAVRKFQRLAWVDSIITTNAAAAEGSRHRIVSFRPLRKYTKPILDLPTSFQDKDLPFMISLTSRQTQFAPWRPNSFPGGQVLDSFGVCEFPL